jgi:DivIVA domain-containing protein
MELTSQDVRARRFAVTRWRRGYERADVDALLVRAAAVLDELAAGRTPSPPLTGEEVRSTTFGTTGLREGYDEREVDDFLDGLAAALDAASAPRV